MNIKRVLIKIIKKIFNNKSNKITTILKMAMTQIMLMIKIIRTIPTNKTLMVKRTIPRSLSLITVNMIMCFVKSQTTNKLLNKSIKMMMQISNRKCLKLKLLLKWNK